MAWMILIGSLVLMSKAIFEVITLRKRVRRTHPRSRVRFFVIGGMLFFIDYKGSLHQNILPINIPDVRNSGTDWRLL